jgi:hypothetical protein
VPLYLGYESAIEYWRAVGSALVSTPRPSPIRCVRDELTAGSLILAAVPQPGIANDSLVHALISKKSRSGVYPQIKLHVCSGTLPAGSFCRISSQVLVASPALCLLHAAQCTSPRKILPLVELCCEFLGSYSLCDGTQRGFRNHKPFLDMVEMRSFIEGLPPRTRGICILKKALELAFSLSASPRETECALMLALPAQYGGYAFPMPELNYRIDIPNRYRSLTDKEYLLLDLYWKDAGVALEYDGSDHNDPARIADDKARRNLLATMGFKTIVLEKRHVGNARQFKQQIRQLCMLLGIEPDVPTQEVAEKRAKLRKHLFDPQHHMACSYTKPLSLPPAPPVESPVSLVESER